MERGLRRRAMGPSARLETWSAIWNPILWLMVDQHAAALHEALRHYGFDVSTVEEMGIACRQEGIRSAAQLERFIRANAQQMG
eukprot:10055068-Lingulodinium_polyedra.AAC.1